MKTDKAFLQAVLDEPDDDAPRLVYADWLEEHGDAARAEFLRVQCELARLADGDGRRWELEARERWLLWHHGKRWAGPLRRLVKRWQFRRGFVEGVTAGAAEFLGWADELFRLAPIRHVRLLRVRDTLPRLARCRHLARVQGLDLRHQDFSPEAFDALARSRHLTGLTSLNLRGTLLCNTAGMRQLAGYESLAGLTSLDLSQPRPGRPERRDENDERFCIQPSGIQALSDSPHLQRLTALKLSGYDSGFSQQAVEALTGAALLGRLTELDLSRTHLGLFYYDEPRAAFFSSPQLANLRVLRLFRSYLGERSWQALNENRHLANLMTLAGAIPSAPTSSRQFSRLTTLVLIGGHLESKWFRKLAGAKHFPALARLYLDECRLNAAGARALAEGPLLAQLRLLSLQGPGSSSWPERKNDWIGDRGAQALADSPQAARLAYLDLGNQRVGDAGAKALAASRHLANLMTLGLWNNQITDAGAKALAKSKRLARLVSLDLRSNPLSANVCQALRQRFGYGGRYGPGPLARNLEQQRKHSWGEGGDWDEEDDEAWDE
jgi:uncharacterized protein (TIGR02996 family)